MRHFGILSIAVALSALLLGCPSNETTQSEHIKDDAIWQRYKAKYNERTGQTRLVAQFRVGGSGGTTIEMTGGATVAANGEALQKNNNFIQGTYYSRTEPGFRSAHTFTWTSNDGTEYTNSMSLPPARVEPIGGTQSARQDLVIAFDGPPRQENEHLQLALRDTAGHRETIQARPGSSSFRVRASVLGQLFNGPISYHLERWKRPAIQQATSQGGKMSIHYTGKSYEFVLNDSPKRAPQQAQPTGTAGAENV